MALNIERKEKLHVGNFLYENLFDQVLMAIRAWELFSCTTSMQFFSSRFIDLTFSLVRFFWRSAVAVKTKKMNSPRG